MAQFLAVLQTRTRPYLGLSRILQASLSVSQPLFVAIIALGGFPSLAKTLFAVSVGFAGYLAVFAVNDLFDVHLDRKRFSHLRTYDNFDIDSAAMRHPIAQNQLPFSHGLIWVASLSIYALIGSCFLNPVAAGLFVIAAALETLYCKLATVTAWKFIPSGLMVAVGAAAGWFAVMPDANPSVILVILLWMYAWEIGGRNIVNDWADVEEDVELGIKTVPVVFGQRQALRIVIFHLILTLVASLMLGVVAGLSLLYFLTSLVTGWFLLLRPGLFLIVQPRPETALFLFNRASLYPPAMLLGLIAGVYLNFV